MSPRKKVCALIALSLSLLFCGLVRADEADLVWSTFLGGNNQEVGRDITVDGSGNAYVTGFTKSTDFPTTAGAFDETQNGLNDVFVVKLNATGSALGYATFLGGSGGSEKGTGVAVDGSGNAYVTGWTESWDFPTTAGAFDTTLGGGRDAFVAELNSAGDALNYGTFLGGIGSDYAADIAVNPAGKAYLVGTSHSPDFPTTAGAFDETFNGAADAFVARLNEAGSGLDYATYLGGSGQERSQQVAPDNSGNACVVGFTESSDFPTTPGAFAETYSGQWDVFVAKFSETGDSLFYATFLGGSAPDGFAGFSMDGSGNTYLCGGTYSADFPTTPGAFDETHNGGADAFVARLNATGSALDYATFLGGSSDEGGRNIVVDGSGNAYVCGHTSSSDFPTTLEAFDIAYGGGWDVFVAKLNAAGSALDYATFLGGSANDSCSSIAMDGSDNIYLTGYTMSLDFPTTPGAFDTLRHVVRDVFVAKFDLSGYPVPVALTSFEATGGEGFVILNWVTASEINCHRWEVYRSKQEDGPYSQIGERPGYGSTETPHTYRWVDRQVLAGVTYYYKLKQVDFDGSTWWSHSVSASSALPKNYALSQNYPNPFNTNTQIRYQIPIDTHVSLKIFNLLGQEVRSLVDADQKAREHAVDWDGMDADGREVASGLYFCRLEAGGVCKTTKMMLIK
jgi:hypothetical protein